MSRERWRRAFETAFDDLRRAGNRLPEFLDPYFGDDPGEFFAGMSEVFFVAPDQLAAWYPNVYAELAAFYRQDPLASGAAPGSI